MEDGSASRPAVLVAGLGNLLLGDDGVGLRLLDELRAAVAWPPEVEFVDGGTQGIALLGWIENRQAVLILDAIGLGAPPGSVHCLPDFQPGTVTQRSSRTAHEGNCLSLLNAAKLAGCLPARVAVVGIEPEDLHTRIGLSAAVERAVGEATTRAREILTAMLERLCATQAASSRIGPCVDTFSRRP